MENCQSVLTFLQVNESLFSWLFPTLLIVLMFASQCLCDSINALWLRIYVKRCEYRWDMLYRSGDNVIGPCHWSGCPFRRDCPFYERQTFWQYFKLSAKRLFARKKKEGKR